MRILVCGGRNYDPLKVEDWLDGYYSITEKPTIVIEGGACGADFGGRLWAVNNNIPVETYKADWKKYRRSAGAVRNAEMLREGKPDLVFAFPGGKGTANMIYQAEKAGVPVRIIDFE